MCVTTLFIIRQNVLIIFARHVFMFWKKRGVLFVENIFKTKEQKRQTRDT